MACGYKLSLDHFPAYHSILFAKREWLVSFMVLPDFLRQHPVPIAWPLLCHLLCFIVWTLTNSNLFPASLSMIEPGPVHTGFEAKMVEDVSQKEFPGTDHDTVHYFKNVYLPSSIDIFETLGQTPGDIARVSVLATINLAQFNAINHFLHLLYIYILIYHIFSSRKYDWIKSRGCVPYERIKAGPQIQAGEKSKSG